MTRRRAQVAAFGAAGVLAALVVWQWLATVGPLADSPLPTATDSVARAVRLLGSVELWSAVGSTLLMAMVGLLLAAVVGVLLGVAVGLSPFAMHATRVPLEFLKPIPPIVILPLVVLVLGPTIPMGVFLVFFGSVFAIAMQTTAGVFDADAVALSTARSFGMRRAEVVWRVVLPSSLPYVGTALRVAAPTSLVIAVVAGLLGGGPGLGQSLLLSQLSGDQTSLFGYVLLLGGLGLLLQGVSQSLERRALRWHPQYREGAA